MTRSTALRALLAAVFVVTVAACGRDAPTSAPAGPRATAGAGVRLEMVVGDGQSGAMGLPLPQSLVVRVLDAAGRPIPDAVVNWVAVQGGGSLSLRQSRTTAEGYAWTQWTLGPTAGAQTVRASGTGGTYLFTATASAAATARLEKVSGDGQSAAPGQKLAAPLVVRVTDAASKPLRGVPVRWEVTEGGGSVSAPQGATGMDGTARVEWTVGNAGAQAVRVSAPGLAAVTFSAAAVAPEAADGPVEMHVIPQTMWLTTGDTARLRVVFLNAEGEVVPGPRPTFRTLSNDVQVDANGLVRTGRYGSGAIEVRAWPFRRFTTVSPSVRTPAKYGSPRNALYVVPQKVHLFQGESARLSALWVDANGVVSRARDVRWWADLPRDFAVTPNGEVTAVRTPGGTRVLAERGGVRDHGNVYGDARTSGAWMGGIMFDGLTMPATVSVASSDAQVPMSFHYRTDSAVRLASFTVVLRGPDGRVLEGTVTGARGAITVPRGSAPGRYEIQRVRTVDTHGQRSEVYPAQLQYMDNPTGFTVTR